MKIKRRILASLLVLVLCLSLTITAFAASVHSDTFDTITGTTSHANIGFTATGTTKVAVNEVLGTLQVQMRIYNEFTLAYAYSSGMSTPGARSYSVTDSYVDQAYNGTIFTATAIRTTHSVSNPSTGLTEYVYSTLDLPD